MELWVDGGLGGAEVDAQSSRGEGLLERLRSCGKLTKFGEQRKSRGCSDMVGFRSE